MHLNSSYNQPSAGATDDDAGKTPLFVSKTGEILTQQLVAYTADKLTALAGEAEVLVEGERYRGFWTKLKALIAEAEVKPKEEYRRIEQQLVHLPEFIDQWRRMAVDTPERFEFFVKVKAQEIASGDENHDYYWALQIRHDQLMALVTVVQLLVHYLREWVKTDPEVLLDDAVFLGLASRSLEEQIYLEAEAIHGRRLGAPA